VIETGTLEHDLAARRISSWIRQAISPGVRRASRTRPRTRAANHDGALPVGTAHEAHLTADLAYPPFCADELVADSGVRFSFRALVDTLGG
jgi:hypothetical protein